MREIIRDLEEQTDSATNNVCELKDQNQFLTELLERLEAQRNEQENRNANNSDDTFVTATSDLTEELYTQVLTDSWLTIKVESITILMYQRLYI